MIDTRLKVFCSVARNLSFTKASRELHISQPAISKHIHELENEYNVALFERLGTRIKLTHAGELLLSHAEKIIDNYRSLNFEMNLLSEQHVGELRLGASTTIAQYVLPPFLASFAQKFRQIKVSLLNGNTQEIEHAIDEHRIDLGLVEGRSNQPHLHYIPFMKDELVLVVNAQSKLAALDEITLDELKEMPFGHPGKRIGQPRSAETQIIGTQYPVIGSERHHAIGQYRKHQIIYRIDRVRRYHLHTSYCTRSLRR